MMTETNETRAHKRVMRFTLAIPAFASLCSCVVTAEQAEIKLAEDERTSYSLVLTAGSFDHGKVTDLQRSFTDCGLRVQRSRGAGGRDFLGVTLPDVPPENVATYMRCLPGGGRVDVDTSKSEGWLYTYYNLEARIEIPRCTVERKPDPAGVVAMRTPSPSILPRSFRFRLPGRITASELETDVQGVRFEKRDEGSVTTVSYAVPKNYGKIAWPDGQAYCRQFVSRFRGDAPQSFETDKFHVTVHSKRAGFNLTTLFTVAGLLISSGIVAAVVRRFMNGPSRTPATGAQESASGPSRRPRGRKGDRPEAAMRPETAPPAAPDPTHSGE